MCLFPFTPSKIIIFREDTLIIQSYLFNDTFSFATTSATYAKLLIKVALKNLTCNKNTSRAFIICSPHVFLHQFNDLKYYLLTTSSDILIFFLQISYYNKNTIIGSVRKYKSLLSQRITNFYTFSLITNNARNKKKTIVRITILFQCMFCNCNSFPL